MAQLHAASSGDWDDSPWSDASSSSDVVIARSMPDLQPGANSTGASDLVISLKQLSKSDPRRQEIKTLASEYKKLKKRYKELKRLEEGAVAEVESSRDDLRSIAEKLEAKEEKERMSGKEFKGLKKKSLEKSRKKYRQQQSRYEDSCLNLKKIQIEIKDVATQVNQKGHQIRNLWSNRGRTSETPTDQPSRPIRRLSDYNASPPSLVIASDDPGSEEEELDSLGKEHDEAFERAREEDRIHRIEQARARFRAAVAREDSLNVQAAQSEPNLYATFKQPPPVPPRETRGRSKSIVDMQKKLGLVSTSEDTSARERVSSGAEEMTETGEAFDQEGTNEERRKKEEILARLQKGRGMSLMPFAQQRETEERELREKLERTAIRVDRSSGYKPLSSLADARHKESLQSSMQTADGRLTYHRRPMQQGKRRPSTQQRRERRGRGESDASPIGDSILIDQHKAALKQLDRMDAYSAPDIATLEEASTNDTILTRELLNREADQMRAELQNEMQIKRKSRELVRQRDTMSEHTEIGIVPEKGEEEIEEGKRSSKRKLERKVSREDDLREEKAIALRELHKLMEDNDRLVRELEDHKEKLKKERKAGKEVESYLARKLETSRKESLQQQDTIRSLNYELTELQQRLSDESSKCTSFEEERSRELAETKDELNKLKIALEARLSELKEAEQVIKRRDMDLAELKEQETTESSEREREMNLKFEQLQMLVDGLTEERDEAIARAEKILVDAREEQEKIRAESEKQRDVAQLLNESRSSERKLAEEVEELKAQVRVLERECQAVLDEKQSFIDELARSNESSKDELLTREQEISDLREELLREREERAQIQEALITSQRNLEENEHRISLMRLKMQKTKQRKDALKAALNRQKSSSDKLDQHSQQLLQERDQLLLESEQWTKERHELVERAARLEEEVKTEQRAKESLEERVKQLEEDKLVNEEVMKRVGQRMEKQNREAEEMLEREREESRKMKEAVEFERNRVRQLEQERDQRAEVDAQREIARLENGERQGQEEIRLRNELEIERKNRELLSIERDKHLENADKLREEVSAIRQKKEELEHSIEQTRDAIEQLEHEKQSLVSLIEIERNRALESTENVKRELVDANIDASKLRQEIESLRQKLVDAKRETGELIEQSKREKESLQEQLSAKDEEITLKKEKTKLLRAKILALVEENQRIKEGTRKDKERDRIERERQRDQESRRLKEQREKLRREREREREEDERIRKEKERIRVEREREAAEKEMLKREMEREREEKNLLQQRKEKELDDLKRDLQEKEFLERTVYCADVNAYVKDVPRGTIDLFTFYSHYNGTVAQKSNFVRNALHAISTSIQRVSEDAEMLSYWLSYTSSLSHLAFSEGEAKSIAIPRDSDPTSELRNLVMSRSVRERGIVSSFYLHKERRTLSRGDIKQALFEAIEKERGGPDNEAANLLLKLEAVMITILEHLASIAQRDLGSVLVPAIIEYRPFLSRRMSMVRREREKERKLRPTANRSDESPSSPTTSPDVVVDMLKSYLATFQRKKLYPSVIQVIFENLVHNINVHLFNALLQRNDLCTSSIGFQIKFGLSPLREWLFAANFADPSRLRDLLNHIEEAANVLVVDKRLFVNEKDVRDIFQILNPVQIFHFLSVFQADDASLGDRASEAVPQESLQAIRQAVMRSSDKGAKPWLKLDPDTLPCSV